MNSATSLSQAVGPSVNHCEWRDKESISTRVVDDDRSNLNSLAEPHIITLKATIDDSVGGAILIWHGSAINFFIEHPVNAINLVREIREVAPERTQRSKVLLTMRRVLESILGLISAQFSGRRDIG
jgi:hypothetical protein